jgi:hypothetical protein
MDRTLADNNQDGAQAPSTSGNIALAVPVTIAEWQKKSRESILVRLDSFKGKATICARLWYRDSEGELKPSPKGLTVAVHHLPQLATAMNDALETARHMGLISEGGDE